MKSIKYLAMVVVAIIQLTLTVAFITADAEEIVVESVVHTIDIDVGKIIKQLMR